MLEMTLATDFVPGKNLKGKVSGAAWLYLLPDINLRRVISVGVPPLTTMEMLACFSQEMVLVYPKEQGSSSLAGYADLNSFERITFSAEGFLPLMDNCADLILLVGEENQQQFNEDKKLRAELARLLVADGLIYCEGREYLWSRTGRSEWEQADTGPKLMSRYWLTPLFGEMQSAVPLDDAQTITYFLQNELCSPMLNLSASLSKRTKRVASRKIKGADTAPGSSTTIRVKKVKRQSRLKRSMLAAGFRLLGVIERAEGLIDQKRPVRRIGTFYGDRAGESVTVPPRYLRSIAQKGGINLGNYRWGLSARGEYSSRKMLFFLFDRNKDSDNAIPDIIIKMVRDPIFSYRLKNEAQSLQLLDEKGFHDPEVLPKIIFSDQHAGLAIVGESIIEGVPFRQKSMSTADCTYGLAALDWFVDLGAATADTQAATPGEIGGALSQLLERFVEIYHPTAGQYDFLLQQIAKISRCEADIPLVFQHGDPGPWNMLVTPNGRVAVLDWEAAEAAGMPSWDLFYFMRSYSLDAARRLGINERLEGFTHQFLNDTPLSRLFITTISRYCQLTGLDSSLIEPLFYTCWMHRALKESMRTEPAKLGQGHFVNLIWWCKEHRDSATLSSLFSLPSKFAENAEPLR